MKTSPEGIEWIKQRESLRLKAYQDKGKVWTIGYGHTKTAHEGMVITAAGATVLLARDLVDYEDAVAKYVLGPLKQCEFDALVSFSFNAGKGAVDPDNCTAVRELNKGNRLGFARNLPRWCKVNGQYFEPLAFRRGEELYQFMGGVR